MNGRERYFKTINLHSTGAVVAWPSGQKPFFHRFITLWLFTVYSPG